MRITLDEGQWAGACAEGVRRQMAAVREGRKHRWGGEAAIRDSYGGHIEGACAECAAAVALGVDWTALAGVGAPDLAGWIEVRMSTEAGNRLILHPSDKDDRAYVLVLGKAPTFDVVGWTYGGAGKRSEFWTDPTGGGRPAYFVPQAALLPIELLAREIRRRRGLEAELELDA